MGNAARRSLSPAPAIRRQHDAAIGGVQNLFDAVHENDFGARLGVANRTLTCERHPDQCKGAGFC